MKKSTHLPVRPRIFVDLDGVLVDWAGAMLQLGGLDPNDPTIRQKLINSGGDIDTLLGGAANVHRLVDSIGSRFWEHLRLFPWARPLMAALIKDFDGEMGHVAFLTSPGRFFGAHEGKRKWQHNNFPDVPLILCKDKFLCASPSALLIDDADYQVDPFRHYGGDAILWPNQYTLEVDGFGHTEATKQRLWQQAVANTVQQIHQSSIWS